MNMLPEFLQHERPPYLWADRVLSAPCGIAASLIALMLSASAAFGQDGFLTRTAVHSYRIRDYVEVTNDSKTLTKLVILLPGPQSSFYQDLQYVDTDGGELVDILNTDEKHYRNTITDSRLPTPGQSEECGVEYHVTTYAVRANLGLITAIYPYDTNSEIYQRYTGQSGEYVNPYNSDIQSMGASIWSLSSDILDYARRCYLYVVDNFTHGGAGGVHPLTTVLANGGGWSADLNSIYVSLLRYRNIPSRHVNSFQPGGGAHVWAEFYMENYGWVPVNVTEKKYNPTVDYFGYCPGNHIVTSRGVHLLIDRGDGYTFYTPHLTTQYWWWWWGSAGGAISSRHEITFNTLALGTLDVTIHNVAGWGSIGTEGVVRLFNSAGQLVASESTDGNGEAVFHNVPTGSGYYYQVYLVPSDPSKIFGEEYWGTSIPVTISEGVTTYSSFNRNMPYTSNILVQVRATGEHVRGDTVTPGTPLRVSLEVTNPNVAGSGSQGVWSRLVIDIDQSFPYKIDRASGYLILSLGSTHLYQFDVTPSEAGDYYHVAAAYCSVGESFACTEGGRWDLEPLFTVASDLLPPTLSSPANEATGLSTSPLLSWNASNGATAYRVQLSPDWDFTRIVYDVGGITATSHQAQFLSGATTHYWRVISIAPWGPSAPSSAWSFTTWSGPYGGTAAGVPGTIQVEWYDAGGEGITYHDVDPTNAGGACRGAEGVDIELCTDPESEGFNIGWTKPGEWLHYSVNVASSAPYQMEARVALDGAGDGRFHVELNQTDVSGPVLVPGTGGNQTWTTVRDTVYLPEGRHILSLVMDEAAAGGDIGNFNFLRFTALPQVNITVGTDPDSLTFTVDGASFDATREFAWLPGSAHTIGTASPQPGDTGTRYIWTGWSDGGAIVHDILASSPMSFTASFSSEYYLSISADTGGVVTPSGGWFTPGVSVEITATPDSGYTFAGWEGTGAGSYTGNENPASIQMSGPVSQRAIFRCLVPLPEPVVLVSPVHGTNDSPTDVVLLWRTCGTSVARYWCEVATDSVFSFTSIDSTIVDTSYAATGLSIDTRYWWRVRACNTTGWGPFSEVRSFGTLALPGQVVLLFPPDGDVVRTDTVQARWHTGAPSVTRYWCELATDSMFVFKSIDSTSTDTTYLFRHLTASTYWWRVRAGNGVGWGTFSAVRRFYLSITSASDLAEVPTEFSMGQNYPNPFNPSTTIEFALPHAGFVALSVYNMLGEAVATLIAGDHPAGRFKATWDASDLPSGVYVYRLTAGEQVLTKKAVLLK